MCSWLAGRRMVLKIPIWARSKASEQDPQTSWTPKLVSVQAQSSTLAIAMTLRTSQLLAVVSLLQ
eukprot:605-Rhodomonas_salina.2